jgi:signal transduction histidine kinase
VDERTQELQATINLLSREIDERIRTERELISSQTNAIRNARLASLGTLAAGVAHEINNPNNAMGFAASTLTRLWKDFSPHINEYQKIIEEPFLVCGLPCKEGMETMEELINEVGQSTQRIASIVSNLKHMAKGDGGSLDRKVAINDPLQLAVTMLKNIINSRTDHFSLTIDNNLPLIRGNPQQLEQVFINLIQNSLQALENRTKQVSVTAKLEAHENRPTLTVQIMDEGEGISHNRLDMITKPFYTTKSAQGGTGLGLSISKTILDNHHGSLSYRSKPGQGTVATVRLPITPPQEEEKKELEYGS